MEKMSSILDVFDGVELMTEGMSYGKTVSERATDMELEEQRYGRKKSTAVDHNFIEKGLYRRKFDNISKSQKLNRKLYRLAKKMLRHRSGTRYEDMYWIDPITYEIVASVTDSTLEETIVYPEAVKRKIQGRKGLITMHSHPNSFPPSISDLNSNFKNEYGIGIVVCHDGTVYLYASDQEINQDYYHLSVEEYLKAGYNSFEAQTKVMKDLQSRFDMSCKEVTDHEYGT